jgi:hypothetical protein
MGFLTTITAQLQPLPDPIVSQEIHEMPQAAQTGDKKEAAVDVETIHKPDLIPQSNVEAGVARVEAVQAVWGKRGKYMIIVG